MVNPMIANTLLGSQPIEGMGGTFRGFIQSNPQLQFGQNFNQFNSLFTNVITPFIRGRQNVNMYR